MIVVVIISLLLLLFLVIGYFLRFFFFLFCFSFDFFLCVVDFLIIVWGMRERGEMVVIIFDQFGWTALHEAAYHGFENVVKILLKHGSIIHFEDSVLIF